MLDYILREWLILLFAPMIVMIEFHGPFDLIDASQVGLVKQGLKIYGG